MKPRSLFPALHRVEEAGWLESLWGESANKRRTRYCRLTAAGRLQLASGTGEWGRAATAIRLVLQAGWGGRPGCDS